MFPYKVVYLPPWGLVRPTLRITTWSYFQCWCNRPAGRLKDPRSTCADKYIIRPTFEYAQYYGTGILVDVDALLGTHIPTFVGLQINLFRTVSFSLV